ncbi:4Fe-4S single cluster domain-containing protein [Crocosphaera sp. XPORK-15E]|uniref:4Fe-4S single cluster domain-containing protein n=1 Tax=Crocosphaera sp. XPORK-15E TaxID=3110247 RepID=UPI002B2201EC|nr:4Fe-4S single cluster domain-containing protein [Crocosphaera sp. XPORK-15E]MEA5536617.1 4Fe-4S single cluster domain-containing protein [Crocosphaera sp. XPORK-15E]
MTLLNIAEICSSTRVLGPGQRCAIWVQGCCFDCPGCVAPDWIPQKQAQLIEPEKLANYILTLPHLDGIAVSGGEPMLQAEGLNELFTYLRRKSNLSIICYSGFTLKQIQSKNEPIFRQLLQQIDVLIDGLYIAQLNDNLGFRGSSNQVVHFLTDRHLQERELFTQRKRDVEIHVQKDSLLVVGVPPLNFSPDLKQSLGLK